MNCPNCGKEMEAGRLFGKPPLIWSPKEKKLFLIPREGEVHIVEKSYPAANICKSCRKVNVDY